MTGNPARLTSGRLVAALDLPADALVQQRIPKKMLADNGAPTPADRRLIPPWGLRDNLPLSPD